MAYDEDLVARIREHVRSRPDVTERKMFGGLTFLIGGNMACGVSRNELMVRTGPLRYEEALTRPEAHLMEFTGRPMKDGQHAATWEYAIRADGKRFDPREGFKVK